jgi:hypothetical protein
LLNTFFAAAAAAAVVRPTYGVACQKQPINGGYCLPSAPLDSQKHSEFNDIRFVSCFLLFAFGRRAGGGGDGGGSTSKYCVNGWPARSKSKGAVWAEANANKKHQI